MVVLVNSRPISLLNNSKIHMYTGMIPDIFKMGPLYSELGFFFFFTKLGNFVMGHFLLDIK